MSLWNILGAPFIEVLLLVGIHTYFGLHVLRRGIIFVDLALAQVAALGGLVAFLAGLAPGSAGASAFALTFAMLGAGLFAEMRQRPGSKVPLEALIGLVYASASAMALLLMAKAPEGAEHLRETMTGALLWVKWSTVLEGGLLFAAVAVVHYLLRRPMLALAEHDADDRRTLLWDFVFYATFGVVVTHAVAVAGVLLVFVFLVAPAALAVNLAERMRHQLMLGWGVGVLVCMVGMALSYGLDLPVAPSVVSVYAAVLLVVGVVRWLRAGAGITRVLWGLGVLGLSAAVLMAALRLTEHRPHHAHHEVHHRHGDHVHGAEVHPGEDHAHGAAGADVPAPSHVASQAVLMALAALDLPGEKEAACARVEEAAVLIRAAEQAQDPFDRVAIAVCLHALDPESGASLAHDLAGDESLPLLARSRAQGLLGDRDPMTDDRAPISEEPKTE